jgi:hypothetical protein
MLQKRQIYPSSNKFDHAGTVANEAITEAIARFLHEALLEKENQQEGREPV